MPNDQLKLSIIKVSSKRKGFAWNGTRARKHLAVCKMAFDVEFDTG